MTVTRCHVSRPSLRPHPASMAALGAVAQLAKAPVSKTGDSRFESWLPRFLASRAQRLVGSSPTIS